ncbi:[protein-PII] uridylyltransferase [Candidatus Halobeggiatoa sp. HSG11]|nr:[protein-PII] uridylyltransferase [Candidatus Halobeggiatoa sp. HSG11]
MYTDLELFNPQLFAENSETEPLNLFRNVLKNGHMVLKDRFQASKNAINYVNQRAWLIDQVLTNAWQKYCGDIDPDTIALIAVGGYGRGELHPYSDIDLLILLKEPLEDTSQIEKLVIFLWDIRLDIGHSVRTLEECEQEATADITVATNLMEVRLLTGSEKLFKTMQTKTAPIWPIKKFFAAKIEEQTQRHQKYDDTADNLEPNIKEGPGGLRDIQMIGWVAKHHFGATTLHDLVEHGFLTEKEYQILQEGQRFLWEIRCLLHLAAGRHEERLLFDFQRTLAEAYEYQDDEDGLGVEKLMRQYYRTIKKMNTLNDMLLQLFQEAILYTNTPASVYKINKRFQIRNNFIEAIHDKVFLIYPFALLEIFLLVQEYPQVKGIRATTIRLILHYNYLIDSIFRQDLRSRSLFIEIFRQQQGLTHALRQMNRYGVLPAYIPEFGKIAGRMQYDLFHVYTVDQHTLFVVRNLRRLFLPQHDNEFPFCSKISKNIPKPELLYLAGLFHDIAKGRGGDHAKLGEADAINFCKQHDLSDSDARLVGWMTRNHLLMSTTVQRQDISDPDVIKTFAYQIEEPSHLDYLFLLTVADIRATNSKLWTSWKESLLTDLYHKTHALLHQGQGYVLNKQLHIQDIQKEARILLNRLTFNAKINKLWKDLGDEYFLCSSPKDVAKETKAILTHKDANAPLVLERSATKGGTEFIMIYTQDKDHLFAETSYFLEQQNLTIIDAYIIPTQGKYTISGYTVVEENGQELQSKERVVEILQGLEQALICDNDSSFDPITRRIPRQIKHFSVPTQVNFTQDHINNHTIIELITTDQPGVLSRIAQVFVSCEVRIKRAKIATFGTKAEDIFFITDYENHALYSPEQLACLSKELTESLDENMPTT